MTGSDFPGSTERPWKKVSLPDSVSLESPRARGLVILLCQDRELDKTFASMKTNLLGPLNADLALFGTESEASSGIDYAHKWSFPEPSDWTQEILNIGISAEWLGRLAALHPSFLGGIHLHPEKSPAGQKTGSGAIILFWRYLLGKTLSESRALDHYDWFVITRSDFTWASPFPPIENLNPNKIYFLNGEKYGGVSDRFILFHRNSLSSVAAVCDELFENPERVYERLRHLPSINPEVFLNVEWGNLGVMERAKFLPYIAFSIRSASGTSRWQMGSWNEELGVFVKYRNEYRQARSFAKLINQPNHWGRFPQGSPSLRLLAATALFRLGTTANSMASVRNVRKRLRRVFRRVLRPSATSGRKP